MDTTAWIAVLGIALTIGLNLCGYLVAWGMMKGQLAGLTLRVDALENEMSAVTEIKGKIIRLETKVDGLLEQFRDLNQSIRWMREPAGVGEPAPTGRRK